MLRRCLLGGGGRTTSAYTRYHTDVACTRRGAEIVVGLLPPPPLGCCRPRVSIFSVWKACEDNTTCRAPGPDARQSQSRHRPHIALYATPCHFHTYIFIFFHRLRFLPRNYTTVLYGQNIFRNIILFCLMIPDIYVNL